VGTKRCRVRTKEIDPPRYRAIFFLQKEREKNLIRLGTGQYFFYKGKGKKIDPPRYRTIFFFTKEKGKNSSS